MCEGASKQSPDLTNYTATGPRPPVLKFLDPPLVADGRELRFINNDQNGNDLFSIGDGQVDKD